MHDFASVAGGLVLLCLAGCGIYHGFGAVYGIFVLLGALAGRGPRGEEWIVVAESFIIGVGSFLILFLSLILLEPVVRFSFLPY